MRRERTYRRELDENNQPDSGPVAAGPSMASNPVTVGKARLSRLDDLDQRTIAAKRAKELVAQIEADLGGAEHLTAAARQLIQRAALLGAIIEHLESRMLAGETIAVSEHLSATNAQRRILEMLGIGRVQKSVDPAEALGRAIEAVRGNRDRSRTWAA